ncbi:alpha/beta hydrolase [Streptomyces sp. NPDC056883]|uniref:alpha/beta hydrolase n=1 Tax=Streptomyces sp. NPDC056883 TaxID=3345959 RepID=UPI0036CFA57E
MGKAKMAIDGGLNRDRDVILMSQRGTYSADPALLCPNVDEFNAQVVGLVYDARSTQRLHVEATKACRDKLAGLGADLSAYNDTQSAADYDDLRTVLGIVQWNLYAISYGTHLALVSMRLHPEGLRSVGLDGIVPPSKARSAESWSSARQGFDGLFKACADQPACNKRYPNLSAAFEKLVQDLEAKPVTTAVALPGNEKPVKVVIDGGTLVNWLATATHLAEGVPRSLDELARGDPRRIARQWAGWRTNPKGIGVTSHGLSYGVVCSEWSPYESRYQALRSGREAYPSFPRSVLVQAPQFPSLHGPYVARTLSSATVITIPYEPHVVFATSKCAREIAVSFFETPDAPKTACVKALKPLQFETGP